MCGVIPPSSAKSTKVQHYPCLASHAFEDTISNLTEADNLEEATHQDLISLL